MEASIYLSTFPPHPMQPHQTMTARTRASRCFALLSAVSATLQNPGQAQTFKVLHNFTSANQTTGFNSDGKQPHARLALSGNSLYGSAEDGGSAGSGTIFKVNTDGTGFTTLHNFAPKSSSTPFTNADGVFPLALVSSGSTLYGTTVSGGSSGAGTVFTLNTDGTGFKTLYNFSGGDGAGPAQLMLSGNMLYGTTLGGGAGSAGTVFAINTNGTGFQMLYAFSQSDGWTPQGDLALSGSTLFGTTYAGGGYGQGVVFSVKTDGTGFTNLYNFTGGSDGGQPVGGLLLSGSTLFGTASISGSPFSGSGNVFAINTDGADFRVLYSFTAVDATNANSDGASPQAGLMLLGNTMYSTTAFGGSSGQGAVFAVNTDGTGLTLLHSFSGNDGTLPVAGLIFSGNTLYGTTEWGGTWDEGTVFSLLLGSNSPPQLTITPDGANIVLNWPTNVAGFTLQSTTNLGSPSSWTAVSASPVIVGGQNTVTSPASGSMQFFRLAQ